MLGDLQWKFSTVSTGNRIRGNPIGRILVIDHGFKIYLSKREKVATGEIGQGHEKLNDCISLGWFGSKDGFFSPSSTMPITWH